MSVTVVLSWLARSRGLRHIAFFLALSWAIGMGVFLFENFAAWRLDIAYVAIDALVIAALLFRANRPGHRFFDLTVFIVAVLVLQMFVLAGLAPTNLHWTLQLILNRTFEIVHISVWVMAGLRILRIYAPRRFEKLFGMPPGTAPREITPEFSFASLRVRTQSGAQALAVTKASWRERWMRRFLADICNDDISKNRPAR
ncbi:MAG: hypothetical protein AAFW68_03315 [Pseudomonadota bacterium]